MAATLLCGDAAEMLDTLPAASVHCCITSPPYFGLRDYGIDGQIGLEDTPDAYVARLVAVFRQVRRVLREEGTVWLNLGDSHANDGKWGGATGGKHVNDLHGNSGIGRSRRHTGLKPKDLIGIPWRVAFALQADGWWLRSDIIWAKPAPFPESVTDRPTRAHEYIFLLAKSERYYYDAAAIAEPLATDPKENYPARARITGRGTQGSADARGNDRDRSGGFPVNGSTRNKRSVWTVGTKPYPGAHFATFPEALVQPMVLAGCPEGGTVLDPFCGSGTTVAVAQKLSRHGIGIDLNPQYLALAQRRLDAAFPLLAGAL